MLAASVWLGVEGAVAAGEPVDETFHGRGVYYFTGSIRCPLAGVGTRADDASNRVALDDDHSTVIVDHARHRITFRNTHRYGWRRRVVGDVLFLGIGTTAEGERSPFGVHLKVFKRRDRLSASVHPHPTTRARVVNAEFDRYEVLLDEGDESRVGLVPKAAEQAVVEPELAARLSNYFLQVKDQLEGKPLEPDRPGARLVDLTLGFGVPSLSLGLAEVELVSLDAANAALVRRGALPEMLSHGSWQLRLHARTPILKTEFDRDLFLFGIDLPLLAPLERRGLFPGEDLVIGFQDGHGYVEFRGERAPIPNPADVARAYLEFHLVGGLITRQIVTLPKRIQAVAAVAR